MTAEPGRDLVCAAVSAVVYGFARAVSEIPGDGILMGQIDVGRRDGYALVSVACKDETTYQLIHAYLEPVCQSLAMLEQTEPGAIRIHKLCCGAHMGKTYRRAHDTGQNY